MKYYYFLTIDKCSTLTAPSYELYNSIYDNLLLKNKCSKGTKPIQCFEYKHKSVKYPNWLHFHSIISSNYYQKFTDWKIKGFSIKLIYIKTMDDMAKFSGYINKHKIDKCKLKPLKKKKNKKEIHINTIYNYL